MIPSWTAIQNIRGPDDEMYIFSPRFTELTSNIIISLNGHFCLKKIDNVCKVH